MRNAELSQMGNSSVKLVKLDGIQCIQKTDISSVESDFYEFVAPQLLNYGVQTPKLHNLSCNTLTLEYIPTKIDLTELSRLTEAYEQLARLHGSKINKPFGTCQHQWTDEATTKALMNINLPDVSIDALKHIQRSAHSIFKMQSHISGDTNNGNWGRRLNGELVLFDWERFGIGCPTIDLAPLIGGMGSLDAFEVSIERYAKVGSSNLPQDPLTNLIVAKSWIAIEVINILVERDKSQKTKYLEWFNTTLPDWLYKMGNAL